MDPRVEAVYADARRRVRRQQVLPTTITVVVGIAGGVALSPFEWVETFLGIGLACSCLVLGGLFVAYLRAIAKEDP